MSADEPESNLWLYLLAHLLIVLMVLVVLDIYLWKYKGEEEEGFEEFEVEDYHRKMVITT